MTHQPTQLWSRVKSGPVGICEIGLQLDFLLYSSLVSDCWVGGCVMALKVKDISIFAAKISQKIVKQDHACQVSFVYVKVTNYINWHKQNLRLDRKSRENTGNLKMQFEWEP